MIKKHLFSTNTLLNSLLHKWIQAHRRARRAREGMMGLYEFKSDYNFVRTPEKVFEFGARSFLTLDCMQFPTLTDCFRYPLNEQCFAVRK